MTFILTGLQIVLGALDVLLGYAYYDLDVLGISHRSEIFCLCCVLLGGPVVFGRLLHVAFSVCEHWVLMCSILGWELSNA